MFLAVSKQEDKSIGFGKFDVYCICRRKERQVYRNNCSVQIIEIRRITIKLLLQVPEIMKGLT